MSCLHGRRSQGWQGDLSPTFWKKILHDFGADTGLYMCELLVWLCVMFQLVFEVKVLYMYVNTDWPWYLLDAPWFSSETMALYKSLTYLLTYFCNYSTNPSNWHSVYILSMVPLHFLPARRYASAGNRDRNVSVCPSVRHAPVLCQNEES